MLHPWLKVIKLDGIHIFERAVIFLPSTDGLNKDHTEQALTHLIKESKSTMSDLFLDQPLFFSDPLEGSMFLVSGPNDEDDEVGKSGVFEEVMTGLHYGTKESLGCAAEMVKRNMVGLAVVRFFNGYCGWEKKQLQKEIRTEYWTIAACSSAIIGLESEVWSDLQGGPWADGPENGLVTVPGCKIVNALISAKLSCICKEINLSSSLGPFLYLDKMLAPVSIKG